MVSELIICIAPSFIKPRGRKSAYYRVTLGFGIGSIVCKTISLETMGWFFL